MRCTLEDESTALELNVARLLGAVTNSPALVVNWVPGGLKSTWKPNKCTSFLTSNQLDGTDMRSIHLGMPVRIGSRTQNIVKKGRANL